MLLCMNPQLRPCNNFDEFVERPVTARQRHKSIGTRRQQRLALVHCPHHMQFRQPLVIDLALTNHVRYHAHDFAASGQRGIRDSAHRADGRSTIEQAMPALGDLPSQVSRSL